MSQRAAHTYPFNISGDDATHGPANRSARAGQMIDLADHGPRPFATLEGEHMGRVGNKTQRDAPRE